MPLGLTCGLCPLPELLDDFKALNMHRARLHPTTSASVFHLATTTYVPPNAPVPQQQGAVNLPQSFTLGYVVGGQSSADRSELATVGGMSEKMWNDFVADFATSKNWTFTPDPSALLSTMLLHILNYKGTNTRTGSNSMKFEDPVSREAHYHTSREFLSAADAYWLKKLNTTFSIQAWATAFEETLWVIWNDPTNQVMASVKANGTKHSNGWALKAKDGSLTYDVPAWQPIGYLFRRQVSHVGELVLRSPVADTSGKAATSEKALVKTNGGPSEAAPIIKGKRRR